MSTPDYARLDQYTAEQQRLLHDITAALKTDRRVLAAWVVENTPGVFVRFVPKVDIHVVLSDDDQATLKDSIAERIGLLPLKSRLLFSCAFTHPKVLVLTNMVSYYAGDVGCHEVNWRWRPRTLVSIASKKARILFDTIGLTQSDRDWLRDGPDEYETSSEGERLAELCGWFWLRLLDGIASVDGTAYAHRRSGDPFGGLLLDALNKLEQETGSPLTGKRAVESDTSMEAQLAMARRLLAQGVELTEILAARGIDVPREDTAEQVIRYIDVVQEMAEANALVDKPIISLTIAYDHTTLAVGDFVTATVILRNLTDVVIERPLVQMGKPRELEASSEQFDAAMASGMIEKFYVGPSQLHLYLSELSPHAEFRFDIVMEAKTLGEAIAAKSSAYPFSAGQRGVYAATEPQSFMIRHRS